jgi:hypothetical protein
MLRIAPQGHCLLPLPVSPRDEKLSTESSWLINPLSCLSPHLELTLIEGHPTPQSLKKLCSKVYDNAMTVPSKAGGGQYGHLGAMMPAAQYQALHGTTAYVAPPNPGVQAPTPANSTVIQISQANRQHDKALEWFTKHHDVCAKLKHLILTAVADCYILALQEVVLGYAQVSVNALIMHLNMMYSTLDQEVLETNCNNSKMRFRQEDITIL